MSFLIGPLTGGLVAGAVYYTISNSIEGNTRNLRTDLHRLSGELKDPSIPEYTPAASKIVYSPFRETLKKRWNEQICDGVDAVRRFEVPWEDIWNRVKTVGQQ